ncbi:MAG: hypothetical protein GTN62_03745 [Gemmatimonadales bacterium]|nr:hypothetical protein [Gemmatimonadales bacterium]NIN10421.1 hypothetical protein [Gemmatimonadales bacterium]NIN49213.1 hypothetical protein [Gemmatimonadales bacterium]NIP06677.1 hypothetical protein [Gemmatimonadales bacterium]NIR00008.1 hypothetical protein [Gemmatimonadales bacterium]
MRPQNASTSALLLLVAVAACSGDAQWTGTVTDSAGITIVSNTADGMWSASERWTVEEELRIGSIEGDPDYQFGQIGFIAVGSDDRIFVLDAQGRHAKVYSADGQYERTIGGPGSGPGELGSQAVFLSVGPGDTLLVPDLMNQRVNRYAPDGSSLGSFPLRLEQGLPMQWRATSSGVIAQQVRPFALPGQPAADSMDAIVRLAVDGTVMDTLMKFPSGRLFSLGGGTPEINLYSPEPVWDLADDLRLLFGVNDDYRIGLYSAEGTLERIIAMPFEPTPVSERDREAVMSFVERMWLDAGVPPAVLPQMRSMIHFGEFFPAFSSIQSGPQGTIWVQHTQSAADLTEEELEQFNLIEDAGAPDWDVFDAEGRYLGTVPMPLRFAPRLFRGNKIYGVWRDELDVQYAMRLRIVGAAEE